MSKEKRTRPCAETANSKSHVERRLSSGVTKLLFSLLMRSKSDRQRYVNWFSTSDRIYSPHLCRPSTSTISSITKRLQHQKRKRSRAWVSALVCSSLKTIFVVTNNSLKHSRITIYVVSRLWTRYITHSPLPALLLYHTTYLDVPKINIGPTHGALVFFSKHHQLSLWLLSRRTLEYASESPTKIIYECFRLRQYIPPTP
jgi:hypothetical protein